MSNAPVDVPAIFDLVHGADCFEMILAVLAVHPELLSVDIKSVTVGEFFSHLASDGVALAEPMPEVVGSSARMILDDWLARNHEIHKLSVLADGCAAGIVPQEFVQYHYRCYMVALAWREARLDYLTNQHGRSQA
ncbi:hypothetical protein CYLTODRAFT_424423 [Cylindrobasidium torrendii FP15055 ss-10]|uniref:Uncharacterized protein n=1 Tax=Cylindrobasidium torrendii FP15055 ss-10 TaxID=1314674 RepID=A0A0D7B4B9_9AGAR|nr:hypothetical protein CYLTODRAFT_424423 [Cylindrobasidium torrendii FP15055 ss-10]